MIRRALAAAALLVCTLCAQPGFCAAASAPLTQTVAGTRVVDLATTVVKGLVTGPDRSAAPAFQVADQRVPLGDVTLVIDGDPYVTATYVGVPVDIDVDGKLARRVMAGFRITTYVRTAVAAHDLAPGQVIAAGDVTLERVPANGRPAVSDALLVGRQVVGPIVKGAPLYLEQTRPETIVKPGQPAILIVHDGPVALSADVVARTGGALGDTVTVFNPQTHKALAGVVTARNQVEIDLPGASQ